MEIGPIISPDGKTLYYCRKDYPPNIDKDKIWYSTAQDFIEWNKSVFMSPPLNNKHHNAIGSITPDGNTILLANQYFKDETAYGDGWSISHKTSDGWSFPENSRIKNFSNTDSYFNCFLGNSGKEIIMNVHRPDTRGETDLYISFVQQDGSWSEPKNLGPELNSAGGECCAFLASDEKTLYFSSDGYNGYGSSDLFVSRRLDDTWQHWSAPANMGEPINSSGWDSYYSLPAKGDYAYFVRDGDIYRVRIAPEVQPEPVLLVYGTVYNQKTKQPVGDASIRYEYLSDGKVAGIASSTPVTGEYKIVLPSGSNYGFLATAKKFISVSDNLDATSIKEYAEVKRDLNLVPAEVGEVIRLNNIFFDFAKAELKSESFPELDRVVLLLNDNPEMNIALGGHTDNVGSDEANLKLSQERINSVLNYLVTKGISKIRMTATGYGETKPIATNDTDEGRARNRRVEFMIVK
jgi:outer membrane protein OmpA-like peptidoglycan-associated protein